MTGYENSKVGSTTYKSRVEPWIHTTNIYEINVRQYTPEGTFNALLPHLPRLKDMGVHTLWFMPITPIAQKHKKGSLGSYYAAGDYVTINPEFGTLDDFKKLVKQAQAVGLKVIIDWVANHTGWDHTWTKTNPEFYLKDPATGDFLIASGMDDIIELDFSNPDLRKAMIDAMKFWVNVCDIDGFRCDLAAWVELYFWQEARPQLDAIKPLIWLGEFDELENPEYGHVFDMSYSWKWMHKTREFYQHHLPLTALESLLEQYSNLESTCMRAWFTSNHDENTWNGTEYEKYGNMAKALAVFSCTWDGVPLIYNGQEIPMLTKRLAFFDKDEIAWTAFSLHDFYRTLLNFHARHPALRGGDPAVTTHRLKTSDDASAFVYLRKNGDKEALVIINFSYNANLQFEILDEKITGVFKNLFSSAEHDFTQQKKFEMDAWEFFVFEK